MKNKASKYAYAKALKGAGWLYYAVGDISAVSSFHRKNLAYYRELGDLKEISNALQFLGIMEFIQGHSTQGRAHLQESLDISRRINNKPAIPRVLIHLGNYLQSEGDYHAASQYYEESLAISREMGEGHLTMIVLIAMGDLALAQKNTLQAREYYKESLEIGIKLKNKWMVATMILNFAEILCAEEHYSGSVRLQGFAETLFRESDSLTETHMAAIKRTAEIPKKHLGEDSYQKDFDIGKALKLEQAVEIALKQQA